jgi:hypothetical protein
MNPLRNLQSVFQSYLLRGGDAMLQRITGTAKVSARQRLAIYYDAYRLRLLEALDSNYPVLHIWIGDEAFRSLGLAYIGAHPSRHFSIRYFGHRLPEFLSTADVFRDKPYVSEMAALEWAISEAFDAPDSPVMPLDEVAAIPPDAWPDMRFQLHASVRLVELRWNAPLIWKAIKAEQVPEKPEPEEWPITWLVWRQDLKTYFRSLTVDEAWALDSARSGNSFADLCEGLCEWIDAQNVAQHAAGYLKHWVGDGLIGAIRLDNK